MLRGVYATLAEEIRYDLGLLRTQTCSLRELQNALINTNKKLGRLVELLGEGASSGDSPRL